MRLLDIWDNGWAIKNCRYTLLKLTIFYAESTIFYAESDIFGMKSKKAFNNSAGFPILAQDFQIGSQKFAEFSQNC